MSVPWAAGAAPLSSPRPDLWQTIRSNLCPSRSAPNNELTKRWQTCLVPLHWLEPITSAMMSEAQIATIIITKKKLSFKVDRWQINKYLKRIRTDTWAKRQCYPPNAFLKHVPFVKKFVLLVKEKAFLEWQIQCFYVWLRLVATTLHLLGQSKEYG